MRTNTFRTTPGLKSLLLLIAVHCYVASAESQQAPDSPAYRDMPGFESPVQRERAQGLVDALNAGTPEAVAEFLERHGTEEYRLSQTLEAHLHQFTRATWRMGRISIGGQRHWARRPPGYFDVIVRGDSTGVWWWLELGYAENEDSRLTGFSISAINAPTFAADAALTNADFDDEVRRLVLSSCEIQAFSGSVLIAREEQVISTVACGMASNVFGISNTIDTKYNLGSMNKMFTAIAIMQLVDRARLTLADPLGKHLDRSWHRDDEGGQATIEHALAHRAGFENYMSSPMWFGSRVPFTEPSDFREIITNEHLLFSPGSQFRYSNSGYVLLGALIERVTGDSYYDVIAREIYSRAGMNETESHRFDEIVEGAAEGYEFGSLGESGTPELRKALFLRRADRGTPAGGGYSTVVDLHRFAVALLRGKLLSRDSLERMWIDKSGVGFGYGYGLGFEVRQVAGERSVGHNGSAPGISANFEVMPESGYVVIVLSNYSNAAVPIARRLGDLVTSRER